MRKQIDLTAPEITTIGETFREKISHSATMLTKDLDYEVGCDIDDDIDHEYQPCPEGKAFFTTLIE
jgi:hypothetical protein